MTQKQVERLIRCVIPVWRRMFGIGREQWDIAWRIEECAEGKPAHSVVWQQYRYAEIHIDPSQIRNEDGLYDVLRHELCHVVLGDLGTLEDAISKLPSPGAEVLSSVLKDINERMVTALTRLVRSMLAPPCSRKKRRKRI